ncbi:DUF3558 family protein [Nocardia sp. NBC_01499]|uniref:DUF3558 family protein n=1 Tax=Nocardia sp. NBC_01499 TaxID=2903597 RepID=UPI0038648BC4
MKYLGIALALTSTAIITVGCTSSDHKSEPTSTVTSTTAKPVLAVPIGPAPDQPRNSRKPVQLDPCVEVGDDTVTKAGFEPKTRERADQVHDDYAFIGCSFDRKQDVRGQTRTVGSLTISSTNLTLDDFRKREGAAATEIKVNGSDAITYKRPESEACFVVLTDPDGTLDISVSSTAALTDWNACEHVQDIAGIVASAGSVQVTV